MQINVFLFKILFLFFPGIIAYFVIELLTECKSKNNLYHAIYIFVLGVLSYTISITLSELGNFLLRLININIQSSFFHFSLNLSNINMKINFINSLLNNDKIYLWDIIFTTIVAIILGLIIVFVTQKGLIHKLAQKYNISQKFSDSTVWGYIFNSNDLNQWITIRDIKNDLVYQGYLTVFSAEHKNNELFLTDVKVYKNSTADFLYDTYGLYITRAENDITIEFSNNTEREQTNG